MRKYLILLTIAICLCTVGCGGKEIVDDAAVISEQGEMEQNAAEDESSELTMDDEQSGAIRFTEEDLSNRINLVDSPEFTLNFYIYRDLEEGYYDYGYEVIAQKSEKEIYTVKLTNLCINENVEIGSDAVTGINDGYRLEQARRVNGYIRCNDIDYITSIKGSACVCYSDGSTSDKQYAFETSVNSEASMGYNLQPYLDAMALTQDMLSNDLFDVQLIGLGSFGENSNSLKGLIHITNKTDTDQIFSLNACVVNNICFDFPHAADLCIKAGTDYYYDFYVSQSSITDAGISSISSVSLLMLTSESENTGIKGEHLIGGQLYDVELNQKGNGTTPQIEGELIYDDNDIKVYLLGGEVKEYNNYSTEFYAYVYVQNNTEKNISFGFSDSKLNGVSCREGGNELRRSDWSYTNRSTAGNIIPSGCCMKKSVILYEWAEIKLPCTASFKLDFYTAGGGELLYRSDEISIDYTE